MDVIEARLLGLSNYANIFKLPDEIVGEERPIDINSIKDDTLQSMLIELDASLADLAHVYDVVFKSVHQPDSLEGFTDVHDCMATLGYRVCGNRWSDP